MNFLSSLHRRRPVRALARALAATLALWAVLLSPAHADEGHDHGGTPVAAAPAQPRFAAVSAAFELVGVREGDHLSLWLDHAADNRPAEGARLELDVGGQAATLRPAGPGRFEATLPAWPVPGVVPVTAIVTLGTESDLLAGQLDLSMHEDTHAASRDWRRTAGLAAGAVALLLLLAAVAVQRLRRRNTPAGAAA